VSRLLYIDCFAGAAGDMFVGALLDLGVPLEALMGEVSRLGLGDVGLLVGREARHGIEGVRARVVVRGREILEGEGLRAAEEGGAVHDHDPVGDHAHDHVHDHGETHRGHEGGAHGRTWTEIDRLLAGAGLGAHTETMARRAFRLLGEAEARVHGIPLEGVHFHEVGAVDALVDVVAACAGVAHLRPAEVVASPVPLGRGTIRAAHGQLPLPAPAVLELLAGVPVVGVADEQETVTPTGAALLVAFAARHGPLPPMRPAAVGYGVGARDSRARPNLLRLVLGEHADAEVEAERLFVIEANVDDMNPQIFEHLTEELLSQGARDVWLTPAQMKKGRPATVLSALCDAARRDTLAAVVLRESTSIGVRWYEVWRTALDREIREVATPWGPVRVKVARRGEEVVNVAPEYEDCRRVARTAGVPLKRVLQAAVRGFEEAR
jgi:hypothetical protein